MSMTSICVRPSWSGRDRLSLIVRARVSDGNGIRRPPKNVGVQRDGAIESCQTYLQHHHVRALTQFSKMSSISKGMVFVTCIRSLVQDRRIQILSSNDVRYVSFLT